MKFLIDILILSLFAGLSATTVNGAINIENALEQKLRRSDLVQAEGIVITESNGVVTLSGDTPTLIQKKKAEDIAATLRGVVEVINTIEVIPETPFSDRQIRRNLRQALVVDPALEPYEISVEVNESSVTLMGVVQSWRESRIAENLAHNMAGVRKVINLIDVQYPESRSDREIRRDVISALKWDALVNAEQVSVRVNNATVRLTGVVESLAEKNEAIADAWVMGVTEVNAEDLLVDPEVIVATDTAALEAPDVTNENVAAAIRFSLSAEPLVDVKAVEVSVIDELATLRGTVETLAAKDAAEQAAMEVAGVDAVANLLKVETDDNYREDELETAIRRAWIQDTYVDRHDLLVDVDGATAKLSGSTTSRFEKARAESLAREVAGVAAVENRIVASNRSAPVVFNPYVYNSYIWNFARDQEPMPRNAYTSDEAIREAIEDALFWSPFVDEDDLTVSVDDGVAVLRGEVDSQFESNFAVANALETEARVVKNRLTIIN